MYKSFFIVLAVVFLLPFRGGCKQKMKNKPNVVFVLVDDLGWADLGYNGSIYHETPNIDKLASEGMIFTDAYAACPVCSPSRAAIVSGKYPARINLTDYIPGNRHWGPHKDQMLASNPFKLQLDLEEYTIAEALKDAGYFTMFACKWHAGEEEKYYPQHQGFDINIGGNKTGHPAGGYFSPYKNPQLTDGYEGEYLTDRLTDEGIEKHYGEHMEWWNTYWAKSSVTLPDDVLQKQYYNEMYKFGSVTRENSYPISLQAVWTADNGKMPPWKGDYHHDLNTQLSAWPTYAGNHLEEGYGYLHTLWNQREINKKYTKTYYGTNGLNVPGVATVVGQPMGGWIQYSLSPTVSAWLAQHFYLHWKYSADREFLKKRGYPYIKDVAIHLEELSEVKDGKRVLPLSSSPEIFNNSLRAWFKTYTNYDLALVNFAFMAAAEMADALGLKQEAEHWQSLRNELPPYELDADGGLAFASGIHEMLIQSHTGVVRVFPAIPKSWTDAAFDNLRTYGAFLVSAEIKSGVVVAVHIKSKKGGSLKLANPFEGREPRVKGADFTLVDGIISVEMDQEQEIEIN